MPRSAACPMPTWGWRCAARSPPSSCSSIQDGSSSATGSDMRWCRRPPTTGSCRPNAGSCTPPMPGRSKRTARRGVAAATRLVEIAHHWRAAQDPARALTAAIAAGDASRAVYAYAEAGRQYERAIELWDLVPAHRPTDRPGPRRSVRLGECDRDPGRRRLARRRPRAARHRTHRCRTRPTTADAGRARGNGSGTRRGWPATRRLRSVCSRRPSTCSRDAAVDRRGARPRGPGREPDAGRPVRRIRPVRRARDRERAGGRGAGHRMRGR